MKKPIISIRKLGDGIYDYAVFRSDCIGAIIKNISSSHAKHIKHILRGMNDIPYKITPIINWHEFDTIVSVDENGYGKM